MRRGALVLACLAACGGTTGVDIEIRPPSGVTLDAVELWVAYDHCHDCPDGIAWGNSGPARGDILFLRDEKVIAARQHGDVWALHLQAESGYGDPPVIAVVGLQAGQVVATELLHWVHIPSSTVEIWRVDLHRTDRATTDLTSAPSDTASEHRAHAWARPPTPDLAEPAGCLVYQKWVDHESVWETTYFVPPSDPDCDGVPEDKECSEFWFQYAETGGNCVTDDGERLPGACVLGISQCADGVTSDAECTERPSGEFMCLPDVLCDECSDDVPAETCVPGALEDAMAADTLPHFDCYFDAGEDGAPCPERPALLVAPSGSATCATPMLHYIEKPFTNPQGTLVFGSGADELKFTLGATPTQCVYELKWTGGNAQTFANGITFLVEVPYTNGTRALYPVWVAPNAAPVECTSVPAELKPCKANRLDENEDRLRACAAY